MATLDAYVKKAKNVASMGGARIFDQGGLTVSPPQPTPGTATTRVGMQKCFASYRIKK
jgi:hypothetical protein